MEKKNRIDKLLANLGFGTRSEIKKIIKSGRVTVNGEMVKSPETKVGYEDDVVCDGVKAILKEHIYYLLNKPAGCVCAREDKLNETVFSYVDDTRKNLSPVGRLDKDTEGLLLITDDGELNHLLMSPAHHVKKTYEAVIDAPIEENAKELFKKGVDIGDDKPTSEAFLEIIENTNERCLVRLTIKEGRYHQVKRMFEAIGRKVFYLKRVKLANLDLDDTLKPGEYRELTETELEELKKCVNLS
ncbi:MAG: rRNA pseudouridine synthase [Lachnospiraceae bacterium]|nr:rRNA pseudouridine synthase [Lachnospiraceae bacterium]